ncbi:MAG: hypothetical protein HQL30_04625 [Candidatus Omnitrophica bacterium]|nr:hypothetical protein [Candidatus Omnitrophota bacterium]
MKKVMIMYSTGGMGHKKAAIALEEAFKRAGGVEIKLVDTLDYGDKLYKFLYTDAYVLMMTKLKTIWGILYGFSDLGPIGRLLFRFRESFDIKSLPGLDKMILAEKPDAIVTTHFILPAIAKTLRMNPEMKAKFYVSVTDYGPHSFWIAPGIDKYFVGSESMVPLMKAKGVPLSKVVVTGIPAVENFIKEYDTAKLRKEFGLLPGKRTIFTLSGGFGVGPMEEILKALSGVKTEIQVIAVSGYNKQLFESISAMKKDLPYPVMALGFSDRIAELMSVSDLMITKAGGISVTEAMNMRLPMILIGSIPGQESWNEELLVSNGAAEKASSIRDIPDIVNRVLLSDEAYERLKEGINKVRKPKAADEIARTVLEEMA